MKESKFKLFVKSNRIDLLFVFLAVAGSILNFFTDNYTSGYILMAGVAATSISRIILNHRKARLAKK